MGAINVRIVITENVSDDVDLIDLTYGDQSVLIKCGNL